MKVISIKLNELTQQLRLITQKYRNRLLSELTQKSKEAMVLRTEAETIAFRHAKQQITAPVDGTIGKLLVHTVGIYMNYRYQVNLKQRKAA